MAIGPDVTRWLFVCVENSCRSQMAEGFARALGRGRVEAYSAGSHPSGKVDPRAVRLMRERGIDLRSHRSKGLEEMAGLSFDVVITMGCGDACPHVPAARRLDWAIPDAKDVPDDRFRALRDLIEQRVRQLLEEPSRGGDEQGAAVLRSEDAADIMGRPAEEFPSSPKERSVTKQEFAEKLAKQTDLSKAKAMDVIEAIFSTKPREGIIATELDADRDFTITGFGTFRTRNTKARKGRNPQTGEEIMIQARKSVSFRAGKGLKDRVRE
ncbi:MAG: HU family DNA-binding protein [Gemmatimonadota bacterium]